MFKAHPCANAVQFLHSTEVERQISSLDRRSTPALTAEAGSVVVGREINQSSAAKVRIMNIAGAFKPLRPATAIGAT